MVAAISMVSLQQEMAAKRLKKSREATVFFLADSCET